MIGIIFGHIFLAPQLLTDAILMERYDNKMVAELHTYAHNEE